MPPLILLLFLTLFLLPLAPRKGAGGVVGAEVASAGPGQPFATPWPRLTIDSGINGADGVRTADLDGDGLLDLVVAFEEAAEVRIYLNPGAAQALAGPWPRLRFASPDLDGVEDAMLADLDGDGSLDLVASVEGASRHLLVYWGPSEPARRRDESAWTPMVIACSKNHEWMFAQALDLDGRPGLEIVAGSKRVFETSEPASVSWFAAGPDPRDPDGWTRHEITPAGWIMSLELRDMDGDGNLDLVISDRRAGGLQQGARWLRHPGVGSAGLAQEWQSFSIGGQGEEVMFLDFADLDGDGLEDILIPLLRPSPSDAWIFARRRSVDGTRWDGHEIAYPGPDLIAGGTGDGKAILVADLNGDGMLDVVSSHGRAFPPIQGLIWMTHGGDPLGGTWTAFPIAGPEGEKFDRIVALDVDGDGDLDLITTDEDESLDENGLGVVLYLNPLFGHPLSPGPANP